MNTAKSISIMYRKMNSMTNSKLSNYKLSSSKTMFLFCIYDNKVLSQAEICNELDMDKSAVAKMIMRLEKDGFIKKIPNPNDTRSVLISLTDTAISILSSAKVVIDDWINESTKCLSDNEKKQFLESLEKITSNLSKN